MKQQSLTGFEKHMKTTRRAQFLADMASIVPWKELEGVVEPVYPKASELGGRPPIALQKMPRMYFLQRWFNLSDPAVEEALYDSASMREFVGVDLGAEPVPDETTICKFRHLLEKRPLGLMKLRSVLVSCFLLLSSLGGVVMAESPEASRIAEISKGKFSFNYYNHSPEVIEFFESKGYQGGGYTWEGLAKAGLELSESKALPLIEFDPEGDALYAYSSSKDALEELEAVIKRISSDTVFRDKCIALAVRNGKLE